MYKVQITRKVARHTLAPNDLNITEWVTAAVRQERSAASVSVCLVTRTLMAELNAKYAHKHYATNVLAFPAELPQALPQLPPLLGDIVICPAVVNAAARRYNMPLLEHWQHIVIHGTLHLLGYDHQEAAAAQQMEAREISLLASDGVPNPYEDGAVL